MLKRKVRDYSTESEATGCQQQPDIVNGYLLSKTAKGDVSV
jgi:hypothetical protein